MREKELILTVVNPHVSDPREAEIVVRGAAPKSGSATVLTHSDIHARNTFDERQTVIPQTKDIEIKGGTLHHTFPPASVTRLALGLL